MHAMRCSRVWQPEAEQSARHDLWSNQIDSPEHSRDIIIIVPPMVCRPLYIVLLVQEIDYGRITNICHENIGRLVKTCHAVFVLPLACCG